VPGLPDKKFIKRQKLTAETDIKFTKQMKSMRWQPMKWQAVNHGECLLRPVNMRLQIKLPCGHLAADDGSIRKN
jgi:hypothetical protein